VERLKAIEPSPLELPDSMRPATHRIHEQFCKPIDSSQSLGERIRSQSCGWVSSNHPHAELTRASDGDASGIRLDLYGSGRSMAKRS